MVTKVNILIVDENVNVYTETIAFFQLLNADVVLVSDSHKIVNILECEQFCMAFISLKFAYSDKWKSLKHMQENIHPIIGLMDETSSIHMEEGLVQGVDAFMVKPLDFLSLKTYLPATLSQIWSEKNNLDLDSKKERRENYDRRTYQHGRRWYDQLQKIQHKKNEDVIFNMGPFEINNSLKIIYMDGKKIELSPKEYQLFRFLTSNHERVVAAEEIISHIWPDKERASEEDVKQYIHLLRKKIEPVLSEPQYLHTVKGFGYIMNLYVQS